MGQGSWNSPLLIATDRLFNLYYPGAAGRGAVLGDINGDGRDDVAVNNGTSQVEVLAGGTQSLSGNPLDVSGPGVTSARPVALGDVLALDSMGRSDGYDDFAIVGQINADLETKVFIYAGNPLATSGQYLKKFEVSRDINLTGLQSVKLNPSSGDFDGDGYGDLAILETVTRAGGTGPTSGRTYIFFDLAHQPPN